MLFYNNLPAVYSSGSNAQNAYQGLLDVRIIGRLTEGLLTKAGYEPAAKKGNKDMKKLMKRIAFCAGILFGAAFATTAVANESNVLDGEALLITSGDPADPMYANAGDNYRSGVGSIFVEFAGTAPFGFLCTASAISDRHILTAAHCLREADDTVTTLIVVFPGVMPGGGNFIALASGFAVNPEFDFWNSVGFGAFSDGDVAIIEMPFDLPASIERYDLYRDTDEFGQETRHYGHGRSGKGNKGATGGASFFYARTGLNQYEQTLGAFFGPPFDQLLYDFDSGGRKHNAMEWWFTSAFACHPENPDNPPQAQDGQCTTFKDGSYPDFKGFGNLEVGLASGDSGGPGFIDGKIAGVHSFGFTHFCTGVTNGTDFSCGLDSSYGEMSGDARVSTNADWIDGVVGGAIPTTPVPEPVPAESASTDTGSVEISAGAKALMGNSMVRRLRIEATLDEVRDKLGIE